MRLISVAISTMALSLFIGADEPVKNNPDMRREYFDNHYYIVYQHGYVCSMTHDPDCTCKFITNHKW